MKYFPSTLVNLTLSAAVAVGLTGCDDPEYPTPTPVTASTVGQARVLLVNAAPGSTGTGTGFTIDAIPFSPALPYLGTSTLTPFNAGSRLFVYNEPANIPATPATAPAGTAALTVARPIAVRSAFSGGSNSTIFLTDAPTRAYPFPMPTTPDQGGIRTVLLSDNLNAPAGAANAKIRFVNLSPSGAFGIFNAGATPVTPLFAATPIRAYRATTTTVNNVVITSYNAFSEVPAGAYTLDVRSDASTALPNTQQAVTFAAGKIYTLYVRGLNNQPATPLGFSVVQHN